MPSALASCHVRIALSLLQEIIQLVEMMYIRFLLSLRNVEHLLHERASMPALKVFDVGP